MAEDEFSEFEGRRLSFTEQLVEDDNFESWIATDGEKQYIVTVLSEPFEDSSREQKFTEVLTKLSTIQSPTLLPIIGFTASNPASGLPTIFYECSSRKPLEPFLKPNDQLSNTEKLIIISGVVAAAQTLEGNGVDVGPLSPESVLLDDAKEPCLFNYGLTEIIDDDCDESSIVSFGTLIMQVMATKIRDDSSDDDDSSDSEQIPIMPGFFVDLYSQCDEDSEIQLSFEDVLRLFMSEQFIIPGADASAVHAYQIRVVSLDFSKKMVIEIYQQSEIRKAQCDELQSVVDYLTEELETAKSDADDFANEERKTQKMIEEKESLSRELDNLSYLLRCFMKPGCKVDIPLSAEKMGIFGYLVSSQKYACDKFLVASQSSGDVYCIIDENSKDNFSTGDGEVEWVQFEFPKPISVCSVKIRSAHRSFMKNWSILAISESGKTRTLYEAKDEPGLNGKGKEMIVDVPATQSKVFRIRKTGKNWAGTNFARIKHVELYSEEPEYCGGVFKRLLERCGGDPHKAAVLVTASNFDFRSFHKLYPRRSLCTLYDTDKPWIQFEITRGRAIVHAYRMKQHAEFRFDKWSLLGSNDGVTWATIDRQNGKRPRDPLIIVECRCNIPYQMFRIVSDMPLTDDLKLRIAHFDIFGIYLEVADVAVQIET